MGISNKGFATDQVKPTSRFAQPRLVSSACPQRQSAVFEIGRCRTSVLRCNKPETLNDGNSGVALPVVEVRFNFRVKQTPLDGHFQFKADAGLRIADYGAISDTLCTSSAIAGLST